MKTSNEILSQVQDIFSTKWKERDGRKVPEAADVSLGNDAVKLDGTVLYADMIDSTGLVNGYKDWFAAEIYKSYLNAACHIIRNQSGVIAAFDGDRVMAIFIGEARNSNAAKSALQINYITGQINKKIKKAYPNTTFSLKQAIGIDSSLLFIARTGIINNNDLVWVGRAANYAAKLCTQVSGSYPTYITEDVFNRLNEKSKFGGNPKKCMWEKTAWKETGINIYYSSWWWKF